MGVCKVCQLSNEEFHYGGACCRACAAFFRRYVHSKKRSIKCVCVGAKTPTTVKCRQCRLGKCLEAGLQKDKVQPIREPLIPERKTLALPLTDTYRIISRDCSKVVETASQWSSYSARRKCLYGENANYLNFYEISCCTKTDAMIMWQMVESLFPQLGELKGSDKDCLLSNFMSKFFLMELAHEVVMLREPREYTQWTVENRALLCNFYGGAMPVKQRMAEEDILRIFWPFWTFYYDQIMTPICERKNDLMESMAQLLLILFDPAYINISEECASLCRVLRNMILRELKGYQTDNNMPDERFFDALDNLNLLEKADKKFQEEIQMCDLCNVKFHEDFRRIVVTQKL